MLCRSQVKLCVGKELYTKGASALPKDFFESCHRHFGITISAPLFIGVRPSQVRGLFVSHDCPRTIQANETIATIPLSKVIRTSTIHEHDLAIPRVSFENVKDCITDDEFRAMASHFYLGAQISSIVSQVPDFRRLQSESQIREAHTIMVRDIIPWVRILDDEDFNEQFVFGMYGMALDSWQKNSYDELTKIFHRNISTIHTTLKLPFRVDLFRRVTRLLIARAEQLPKVSALQGPTWKRKLTRAVRLLRKQPVPTELGVAPLLDLINHSNRPNLGVRFSGGAEPKIVLHTLCPVHPGQELCRHYNFALSRPNALFRYGFLPFDLISVIEHDAIHEHLIKNQHMMADESPEEVEKKKNEMEEIARLEKLFRTARSSGPKT